VVVDRLRDPIVAGLIAAVASVAFLLGRRSRR
jgi:hypothetical protein